MYPEFLKLNKYTGILILRNKLQLYYQPPVSYKQA